MSVGKASEDLKAIASARGDIPAQSTADGIDEVGRKVREVPYRLVLHLAPFAVGASEQVRLVDLALVLPSCSGYMDNSGSYGHMHSIG